MNNVLLAIGALLIAVLATLFAVPLVIDWNGYRGLFEEEASRVLGRDVRVGSGVQVRFLPVPYVQFERLRIADTSSDTGDPFFKADGFTMWLSLAPLLRGALEAREIELRAPVFRLVIDNEGNGNWGTFSLQAGSLPFVPSDVALQSVRITNGQIHIARKDGYQLVELAAISGQFEADSLDGPFRFKGAVSWEGGERDVRIVTAKTDLDGALRLKAAVRVAKTASSYTIDGRISDPKRRPRLDGEVLAKLTLAGGASRAAAEKGTEAEKPALELKSPIEADGTGLKLRDIQITFENVGQPQLASGEAQMAWVGRPALQLRLASRWLDFDRLSTSGAAGAPTPLETSRALASQLMALLPAEADCAIGLAVDQVNLGADAVSNLKIAVGRASGPLEIREFVAALPGGARIDLGGQITDPKATALAGNVLVRGTSLSRFLSWAAKGSTLNDGRSDGSFLMQGRFAAAEKSLDLVDAAVELGGTSLRGEFHYTHAERRKIGVVVDTKTLDATQLWPTGLGGGRLEGFLAHGLADSVPTDAKSESDPLKSILAAVGDTDLKLRVKAGELTAGGQLLRDVDLDLGFENGNLSLPGLKLTTADGLLVDLEGAVASVMSTPKGRLYWVTSAPTAASIATLARLSGAAAEGIDPARLEGLAPLRLAGSATFGGRTEHSMDIAVDGSAAAGRLKAAARLDGGRKDWRIAPADLAATLDDTDLLGAVRLLLPMSGTLAKTALSRRGQAFIKASGVPERGMLTLATLAGDGFSIAYEGKAELARNSAPLIDGRVRISSKDARNALALIGVRGSSGFANTAVDALGSLKRSGDVLTFDADRLTIGAGTASGRLTVTARDGKLPLVAGQLSVDRANVQGLLTTVVDPTSGAATVTDTAGIKSVWPEQPFDLNAFEMAEGTLTMRFGTLTLEPGLAMADAVAELKLEPGKLAVTKLDAGILQGRLLGKVSLEKASGGVELRSELKFENAKLESLAATSQTRTANGSVTATMSITGRGLTPGALIATLRGNGHADIGNASIGGFRASAVSSVAQAAIEGKGEREGEGLAKALRDATLAGSLKLGPRKVPLEIADGGMRIGQITVEDDDGRTMLEATLDLSQLKVDAEWKLEGKMAKRAGSDRLKLPAVSAIYVGLLKDLAVLEQRWSVGAFERELAVRKMERDVEELERLRKLDEERAAQERERIRALEAERQRAAAEQAAAAAARTAPAPSPDGKPAVPPFAPPTTTPANGTPPAPAPTAASPAPDSGAPAAQPAPQPRPVPRQRTQQTTPFGFPQPF